MSQSKFFQQWHAGLEETAARAYAAASAPSHAGPSRGSEPRSSFMRQWHAELEEKAAQAYPAGLGHRARGGPSACAAAPSTQREVKRLFRVVEEQLAVCIGVQHPLFAEWQGMLQQFLALEAQYQRSVRDGGESLFHAMCIFHPKTLDGAKLPEANKTNAGVWGRVHWLEEDAKRIEHRMFDLQDEIEAFPARVMHAMNGQCKPRRRGVAVWLKKLRMSLSRPIKALAKALWHMPRPCSPSSCARVRLGSDYAPSLLSESKQAFESREAPSTARITVSCPLLVDGLADYIDACQLMKYPARIR